MMPKLSPFLNRTLTSTLPPRNKKIVAEVTPRSASKRKVDLCENDESVTKRICNKNEPIFAEKSVNSE